MSRRLLIPALAACPFVYAATLQSPPTCEQVYKNIQVFKGVPASDLVPAMEFMCASLNWQCADCHDPKDFTAETRGKETARKMVLMQRDINAKFFNGKLEVTCMSCHGGREHPAGTPIPQGLNLRHERIEGGPTPQSLIAKHLASVGTGGETVQMTGTMTAPSDGTLKIETHPLIFVRGPEGKFMFSSGERKVGSDGAAVWYDKYPLVDEPAAIFGRMGRSWRSESAFKGLDKLALSGKDSIGKTPVLVVRGSRASTNSTEELWFDQKTGLLVRVVNIRRSSIGAVVTSFDYSNFKTLGKARVPLMMVATFADGTKWIFDCKAAAIVPANDALYKAGG